MTSLGTTRRASGAEDTRSLVAAYWPGTRTRARMRYVPCADVFAEPSFPLGPLSVTCKPRSAGTTAPRKSVRRPHRTGFGPVSVSPYAVIETDCVAVVPSFARTVAVAVQCPAAYTCSTVTPSAEPPSPKSQCAAVASLAVKVTWSGA